MAYSAYQHYKPARASGVTQLPRHWNAKRLRFAVCLNPSRNEVELPGDALVSFVPMDAVGELGGLTLEAERQLDEAGAGYTYFADGDVVVAKITPCFENGKGALASGLTNGVALGTTELHVVRAGPELDARFLFYLSISDHFRDIGESEMYGAGGQKRIPDTFIKDFRAGLPPRPEQHIIVEFLGRETARIDALMGKKRRLLELLEEKRLAVITHAVTKGLDPSAPMQDSGIAWLGQIPAHWETKQARFVLGKGVYGISDSTSDAGEYGVLRMGDIGYGDVSTANLARIDAVDESLLVEPGDLLFNRTNSYEQVAKVGLFRGDPDQPVTYASYLVRFRPKGHSEYLRFLLNIPPFLAFVRSPPVTYRGSARPARCSGQKM
jgi:restriction endonuclease S subunit